MFADFLRLAAIIGSLPVTLQNGTTADATQVMSDLNWIVNQVNANAAPLATAALTNANNNFTVVQSGVAATAAANFPIASQVQNSVFLSLSSTLGTNTITARCAVLPLTAYAAGQIFTFIPSQPNTGSVTISVDSAGVIPFLADNVPLRGGELRAGIPAQFLVDTNINAQLLGVSAGQVQNSGLMNLTSTLGTNTLTARSLTLPLNAYATGQIFAFVPSQTNTGPVGITIDSAGSSSIFSGGASLIGAELSAGVPALMERDASKFNLLTVPYSVGSWTPTLTFATPGDLNVAYSTRVGSYTKVGRMVSLSCSLVTSTFTFSTSAGGVQITGLPFIAKTLTGYRTVAAVINAGLVLGATAAQVLPVIDGNTSLISFLTTTGSPTSISTIGTANTASGTQITIQLSITYEAAL